MLRPSFLIRRMGSAWLLVSCLMLSVLITSALVAALLSFYSAALPATVGRELASSGAEWITLSDQAGDSPAAVTRLVSARLRDAFGTVPYRLDQGTWSNDIALSGSRRAGNEPVLQAAALTGVQAQATLTAGRWPAAPQPGRPVPVALPARVAADLKAGPGSVLTQRYVGSRTTVRLVVTGVFRPRVPAAAYWRLDLIGPSGVSVGGGFASYGPAVVSPAAFSPAAGHPAALPANEVSFVVLPRLAGVGPADLDALGTRLGAAITSLRSQVSLVSTTLPQVLIDVAEGLAAAKSLLVISGLQLLLLAAAALALAGRLLASHRDEETAVLTARGAARWQLVRPNLAEALLACAVAAAAGAIAGARLAALLLTHLAGPGLRVPGLGRAAWLGAAVVLLFCLGIVLWPALRPPSVAAVRIRRGRPASVASAAAVGLDVALIALALLAVHELLGYSAASGLGIDPVIVAAPVLALAGLALIPLRLLPWAARGLEKLSARGRRLGTAMANWEISRRPVRQSGPALLVILAVGTSTLALAQYQSWRRSVQDQAAFTAGAPVRVGLAAPEPMTTVTHLTGLPGVRAAMPVGQETLSGGQLLVIGAAQAAATVTMRPDLSARLPLTQLWSRLGLPAPAGDVAAGLTLPGRPDRLKITASMAGGLGGQLGPVSAVVTVQDRYGLTYTFPAGQFAADGRPHSLIASLARSAGAAYPLRLLGVSLTYRLPLAAKSAAVRAANAEAVVTVGSIAVSNGATGPFAAPFASGQALAGWRPSAAAPVLTELSQQPGGAAGSSKPSVRHFGVTGTNARLTIAPGRGPDESRLALAQRGFTSLPAEVRLTIPPDLGGVPLIATSAFLRANGLRTGSAVPLTIGGADLAGRVVATVSQFPTMADGGVVAGQSAVQDALAAAGDAPLPATSWWLTTAGGLRPAGLPAGATVVDADALVRELRRDPVSAAPVQAALAVAVAAALLAVLGFCVSVAASARARRGQRAVLAALGVPAVAQARLFCLEEIMISGPAAIVGLALGLGLARLLIPSITLTATAGLPVPAVLVTFPLAWVLAVAVAVPAIPVLAAAVTSLRQPDPAAELRATEAAG